MIENEDKTLFWYRNLEKRGYQTAMIVADELVMADGHATYMETIQMVKDAKSEELFPEPSYCFKIDKPRILKIIDGFLKGHLHLTLDPDDNDLLNLMRS